MLLQERSSKYKNLFCFIYLFIIIIIYFKYKIDHNFLLQILETLQRNYTVKLTSYSKKHISETNHYVHYEYYLSIIPISNYILKSLLTFSLKMFHIKDCGLRKYTYK